MTEAPPRCAHEACTCEATEGEYCSDYCREHAGKDVVSCGCGHRDCDGTMEEAESAVG
jgi:hypothetical protein